MSAASMRTWRLGHRSGLDGLRGFAVLLVVFAHLFPLGPVTWLGSVGVTLFFVLSGFLITSLLLEELAGTGSLVLRRFYLRRARRLAPALVVMVAVVALLSLIVPGYANWPMLVGTLTWSANWVKIWQVDHGLFNNDAALGTPLAHTWSLAVEEQFYLLWPLLLPILARHGRRVLLSVTALGIAVTAALPLTLHDPSQIYYGSLARAMPLLLGCLLAAWMHRRPEGRTRGWVAALAFFWLPLLWAGVPAPLNAEVAAVLGAVAVFAVAQGGETTFLDARWLRRVGQRSYGLYLWHLPIYALIGHTLGAQPWLVAVLGIPAAWAATELSWRYVESPFKRHRGLLAPGVTAAGSRGLEVVPSAPGTAGGAPPPPTVRSDRPQVGTTG